MSVFQSSNVVLMCLCVVIIPVMWTKYPSMDEMCQAMNGSSCSAERS
jgi:hypothetical protein